VVPDRTGNRRAGEKACFIRDSTSLFFVFPQFRQRREIFQRAGIAQGLIARSYLPQQTAHNLAAAGFRQCVSEPQIVGTCERANFLHDVLLQLLAQRIVTFAATFEGDKCKHRLPLHLVGPPNHRGLCDHRMGDQGALDLHRPSRWPETLITSSTRPIIQK